MRNQHSTIASHRKYTVNLTIQRKTGIVLGLLSLGYFLLFIPANLTGAKDPNMLSVFLIDEFGFFPTVMNMTLSRPSLLEVLKHAIVSENYTYGYPFWLTSALAILPIRVFEQLSLQGGFTQVYLLLFRQLSALFIVGALLAMVYLWTGFQSIIKSVALFLLLAVAPSVFHNNLWWHPESLTTLFVVLTIFFLVTDQLRFGRRFFIAAACCGVAVGLKLIGVFFVLTVPMYLLLGWARDKNWLKAMERGMKWTGIMVLTVIATNPLVLIPMYASRYIQGHLKISEQYRWGWGIVMETGPVAWYAETLKDWYGFWWFYGLVIAVIGISLWRVPGRRLLNLTILSWAAPFSLYLLFVVAHKNEYYFIPIMLPLFACLGNLFEPQLWTGITAKARLFAAAGLSALIGIQVGNYIQFDSRLYHATLNREKESPSILFYEQLAQVYLSKMSPSANLVVYRDPYIYVPATDSLRTAIPDPIAYPPASPSFRSVHFRWGEADYEHISSIDPDLILLQQSVIALHSDPATPAISQNREQALRSLEFYGDAKRNAIPGYRKLLETEFGVAFVRDKT